MKTIDFTGVKTLEEFQERSIFELEDAHGKGYCDQHKAIQRVLYPNDRYMELGVFQGSTASTALLRNPGSVYLVDINLKEYRKWLEPLALEYCERNSILLSTKETNSILLKEIPVVDVLLIDSLHKYNHLKKELELFASHVKRNIIIHDTSHKPELFRAIKEFCNKSSEWKVEDRNEINVGYTLMKRI